MLFNQGDDHVAGVVDEPPDRDNHVAGVVDEPPDRDNHVAGVVDEPPDRGPTDGGGAAWEASRAAERGPWTHVLHEAEPEHHPLARQHVPEVSTCKLDST